MSVSKNEKSGKWEVRTYYKDFTGVRKQKTKRGFEKKSDAIAWERSFHLQQDENLDMYFKDFVEIYIRDKKPRVKYNTWLTKEYIIENKILPYFGNKKVSEIKTSDILQWQNEIMKQQTKTGKKYSKTYLKTIHNQLSAILNHACNMYGLKVNMARRAGNMGIEEHKEMLFWTQEEYQTFIEAVADKEESFIAFEILYWCGIRMGELLALTPADFDFEKCRLHINKSFQRLQGKNVITSPKTPKSNRLVSMPQLLADKVKDYMTRLYAIEDNDRIFEISKSFLHHEMDRGVRLTGVKRIRIHDLRHSHVSLLINMGYSALAIGDRVGHEAIAITYRYAHLFPSIQSDMAVDLNRERASMVGFEPDVKRGKADIIDVREKERRKEQMAKPYNRFSVVTGGRSRA